MRSHRWCAVLVAAGLLISATWAVDRPLLFRNPAEPFDEMVPGVAIGDVNGDGIPDLAIARGDPDRAGIISLRLGRGDRTFDAGVDLPVTVTTLRLALARLDADAALDLVVLGHGGVRTYRGNGDGTFQPPVTVFTPTNNASCRSMEVADVNGDGSTDVIVLIGINGDWQSPKLLLNQGNGSFQAPLALDNVDAQSYRIVPGDFNGDGLRDLVANSPDKIQVHLARPTGGYASPLTTSYPGIHSDLAIADYNRDGKLDVLASGRVFLGTGTGGLTPGFTCCDGGVDVADFNRDGILDVVSSGFVGDLSIFRGVGNGTFEPARVISGGTGVGSFSLQVADLDVDGWPDVVYSWNTTVATVGKGIVGLLFGGPDQAFGRHIIGPTPGGPVLARDLDDDGREDVIVAGRDVAAFLRAPAGGFAPPVRSPNAPPGTAFVGHAASFFQANGDGRPDLVMVSGDATSVVTDAGAGGFHPPALYIGGERHAGIAGIDLEPEGDEDIATGCDGSVCVRYCSGDGTCDANHYRFQVDGGVTSLVGADLNEDGRQDLLGVAGTLPQSPLEVVTLLGVPGWFTRGDSQHVATPGRLHVSDINADGHADLLAFGTGQGLGVFLGMGDGHLASPVFHPTAASSSAGDAAIAVADFDQDGHGDVALLETFESGGLLEILLGDGLGGFPRRRHFIVPERPRLSVDPAFAVGEFNGDGWPDIVLASDVGAFALLDGWPFPGAPMPPVAAAGPDQTLECASPGGTMVTLDGGGSTDPNSTPGSNDDIASYDWSLDDGGGPVPLGSGRTLTTTLGLGSHLVTLKTTDWSSLTSTDQLVVTVRDTTPPVIAWTLTGAPLWPPNHRMVPLILSVAGIDACTPSLVTLQARSSSEPDDAPGDGDGRTTGDLVGPPAGSFDGNILLRAERDAAGPGRTYTFAYQASDGSGNVATRSILVGVPHDQDGVTEPLILRMRETGSGTLVEWDPVPGATRYNVIFGQLGRLRALPQGDPSFFAACIAPNVAGTDTSGFELGAVPPIGEAWFFLAEFEQGTWHSGYGTESAPYDRAPATPGPAGTCPENP